MAIVRVQGTTPFEMVAVDSGPVSFSTLPTVGNAIVVLTWFWNANVSPSMAAGGACSDNQGNTYTLAVESPLINASSGRAAILYCPVIGTPSGTFTVTVNPSQPSAQGWVTALEVSGLAASPLDKTQSATAAGATAHTTGATATTTDANELIVAACLIINDQASIVAETVSPVWTQEAEGLISGGSYPGEADSRIVSSTGAYTGNWTSASSSDSSACIATFKAAATGVAIAIQAGSMPFLGRVMDVLLAMGNDAKIVIRRS